MWWCSNDGVFKPSWKLRNPGSSFRHWKNLWSRTNYWTKGNEILRSAFRWVHLDEPLYLCSVPWELRVWKQDILEKCTNTPDIQSSWSCIQETLGIQIIKWGKIPVFPFTLSGNTLEGVDYKSFYRFPWGQKQKRSETLKRSTDLLLSQQGGQERSQVGHFVDNLFLWRSIINYHLGRGSQKRCLDWLLM